MLKLLLQNLFNSQWPREFNGAGFCLPEEDATIINSAKQISHIHFSDEDMQNMAKALVTENQHLKTTIFYQQWIYPVEAYFISNKIELK
jgi:hypothetical protein